MSKKSSKDEIETSQNALDPIAGYSGAVVSTSIVSVQEERDSENVQLKKSINEKSSKLEKLQYKIRSLNEGLMYEKLGNYNLWKRLSKERQTILELNRNSDDLKSQLEDATNGLQDARKEVSAKVLELQNELSENHAKVVDMDGEIQNFNAQIVDLTSRNTKLMCDNQSISRSLGDLETGLENICIISIKSFEKPGVNITPETHKTLKDYFEKNFQEKTNVNDHSIAGSSDVHDESCSFQSTSNPPSTVANENEPSEDNNSESSPLTAFGTPDSCKVHYPQSNQVQSNSNVDCTGEKLAFGRQKSKRRSKGGPCFYPPSDFEDGRKSKRSKMRKTTWSHYQEISPVWQIPQSRVKAECEKDDGTTQDAEESTDINAESDSGKKLED